MNSFWILLSESVPASAQAACPAKLSRLPRGDQSLLLSEEMEMHVLDLDLDLVNGVGCLDVQGDGFALGRSSCLPVNGVRCLGRRGDGLALEAAPTAAHNSGGAALGQGRCLQRWSVSSFWML